jgi:hypothetical protein
MNLPPISAPNLSSAASSSLPCTNRGGADYHEAYDNFLRVKRSRHLTPDIVDRYADSRWTQYKELYAFALGYYRYLVFGTIEPMKIQEIFNNLLSCVSCDDAGYHEMVSTSSERDRLVKELFGSAEEYNNFCKTLSKENYSDAINYIISSIFIGIVDNNIDANSKNYDAITAGLIRLREKIKSSPNFMISESLEKSFQKLEMILERNTLIGCLNDAPTEEEKAQAFNVIINFYKKISPPFNHYADALKNFMINKIYDDFRDKLTRNVTVGGRCIEITDTPFYKAYITNCATSQDAIEKFHIDLYKMAQEDRVYDEVKIYFLSFLSASGDNPRSFELGAVVCNLKNNRPTPAQRRLPESLKTKLCTLDPVKIWENGASQDFSSFKNQPPEFYTTQRNQCRIALAHTLWKDKKYTEALNLLKMVRENSDPKTPEAQLAGYLYANLSPNATKVDKDKAPQFVFEKDWQDATPGANFDHLELDVAIDYLSKSRLERAKIWMNQHTNLKIFKKAMSTAGRVAIVAIKVIALVGALPLLIASLASYGAIPLTLVTLGVGLSISVPLYLLVTYVFKKRLNLIGFSKDSFINLNVLGDPEEIWFPTAKI